MQKLAFAVKECPDKSGTVEQQTGPAENVTQEQLHAARRIAALSGDQPNFPGFHRQGLPAMPPEPEEICEQDQKDMSQQNPARRQLAENHANDKFWQDEGETQDA